MSDSATFRVGNTYSRKGHTMPSWAGGNRGKLPTADVPITCPGSTADGKPCGRQYMRGRLEDLHVVHYCFGCGARWRLSQGATGVWEAVKVE